MLRLGSQNISALYLGGQEIKRAYLGDALVFDSAPAVRTYTITASIDPSGAGTVTGAGQYKEGESVTIRAVPGDGYKFTGWRENGAVVSTSAAYTFTVTKDRSLTAVFAVDIVNFGWVSASLAALAICYGNKRFVATYNGNPPRYSTDGINWTLGTWDSGTTGSPYYTVCTYCSNIFIALGGQYTQYSYDGKTWVKPMYTSANVNKYGLSTDGTRCICFPGLASKIFYTSEDGKRWLVSPVAAQYKSSAYGNGKFVMVGYNTNTAVYFIWGNTPVQTKLPVSAYWISVVYGGGKFVTIAYNSNHAAYSTDGITWKQATLPGALKWQSVAYGDGKFVAVADGSDKVAYSKDGESWSFANDTLPGAWDWRAITYGLDKFVAVGSKGAAYSTLSS